MATQIREAVPTDRSLVLHLIQQKAEFDTAIGSFTGNLLATEAKLQQTLFGPMPFARVLLAEVDQQAIGFALYYFRYASFKAQPSLWLDDLYVDAAVRSRGVGGRLMQQLVQIAQQQTCSHLAWNAWADNDRAVAFYQRLGGHAIEQSGKCISFQLEV